MISSTPCTPDCPGELKWAIPAGVLNAFWGDVLPRLVSWAWMSGSPIPQGKYFEHLNTKADPVREFLNHMQKWVLPPSNAPVPQGKFGLNPLAKARFDRVETYLTCTQGTDWRIPIRFMGDGGYDFLLSDQGLDVFVPERPETPFELLRYYTFRRTGRRPIGTPVYLSEAHLATSTDSPTGPGQVVLPPEIVLRAVLSSGLDLRDSLCPTQIDCAVRDMGVELPEGFTEESDRWAWFTGDEKRFYRHYPELWELLQAPVNTTLEKIHCLLQRFRCWQIEGSVYRGIMTEFPRLVAEIWLEEVMDVTGPNSTIRQDTYHYRMIQQPGEAREVFEERLETMLPDEDRMKFEATAPGRQAHPGPGGCPQLLQDHEKDIWITNQGIYFPEIPDLQSAFGANPNQNPATVLDGILTEIASGRAGNPVFTDSVRTDGRG